MKALLTKLQSITNLISISNKYGLHPCKRLYYFLLTRKINPVIDIPTFMTKYNVDDMGAIAQLGERLTGSQEVVGSIPSSSTKY